jgi:ferrous iron transport protein B
MLLGRVFSPVIFLGVIALELQAMTSWARPLTDVIQSMVGVARDAPLAVLPPGDLRSLVADSAIAGVGSVIAFLQQITIRSLLKGCWKPAVVWRGRTSLTERFIRPLACTAGELQSLVSGYACAVPTVMATRIDQRAERATRNDSRRCR